MPKPIAVRLVRNDDDHQAALARIEELWNATDPDSLAEMDALVGFVDAYEQKVAPFETQLDPIDFLKHAMSDDGGHTRAELNALVGYSSRASEILARKRPMTLDMIRAISAAWGIPIALLVEPYALAKSERAAILNVRPESARAAKRNVG
jgi:HTH-type transcriptional regulator/antitoxin HigA